MASSDLARKDKSTSRDFKAAEVVGAASASIARLQPLSVLHNQQADTMQ